MKRFWGFVCCLIGSVAWAQTSATVLDIHNAVLTGKETQHIFDGSPAVLIEPPVPKAAPVPINPAATLPAPDIAGIRPEVKIRTPFGHNRSATFTDQITDYVIWVRFTDNETVHVTEEMRLITTKELPGLTRLFPESRQKVDTGRPGFELISVTQDGQYIPHTQTQTDQGTIVVTETPLRPGVHTVVSEYLTRGQMTTDPSLADLKLDLTGQSRPYVVERLTIIVLMPGKSNVYTQELLFGSNLISVPEQYRVSPDLKGNLIFQTVRPLPAFADVRLHLIFDQASLPAAATNFRLTAGLIFAGIWLMYVLLTIGVCRLKKWSRPLISARRVPLHLWQALLFRRGSRTLRLKSLLYFSREYLIGLIFLGGSMIAVLQSYDQAVTGGLMAEIVILSLLGLMMIERFGIRAEMNNLIGALKNTLLKTPQGLNLASRDIETYYNIADRFGFAAEWRKRLITNNPSYGHMSFLTRKEKHK